MTIKDCKLGMKVRHVQTGNESVIVKMNEHGWVQLQSLKTGRLKSPRTMFSYVPFRMAPELIVNATIEAFSKPTTSTRT